MIQDRVGSAKLLPGRHWIQIYEASSTGKITNCALFMDLEKGARYTFKPTITETEKRNPEGYAGSIQAEISSPGGKTRIEQYPLFCAANMNLFCLQDDDCNRPGDYRDHRGRPFPETHHRCMPLYRSPFGYCTGRLIPG